MRKQYLEIGKIVTVHGLGGIVKVQPWCDDMYMYDLIGDRHRILSFNREKLEEWWQEDVRVEISKLKSRLEELEKCLNQK